MKLSVMDAAVLVDVTARGMLLPARWMRQEFVLLCFPGLLGFVFSSVPKE